MKRALPWLAAVVAVVALVVVFVWAATRTPDVDTAPTGVPTLQPNSTPTVTSTPTPTPTPTPDLSCAFDDDHGHDRGHDDDEGGPTTQEVELTCEDIIPIDDTLALQQELKTAAADFVAAWVSSTPDTSDEERRAALAAAGASPELVDLWSVVQRKDDPRGVSATTSVDSLGIAIVKGGTSTTVDIAVLVNVEAEYRLLSGAGTDWVFDGNVTVTFDRATKQVIAVQDSFPDVPRA